MNLTEKLMTIQATLKAPKGQFNAFGKYRYRSCEDVLEALKPLLQETRTVLTISDDMIQVGDRYYIRATATLRDCDSAETISNTAYAREEETKKGMDGSQITGASSSYARKYALNGIFCIDDVKDSDSTNTHGADRKQTAETLTQIFRIVNSYPENNLMEQIRQRYGVQTIKDLSESDSVKCLKLLKKFEAEKQSA